MKSLYLSYCAHFEYRCLKRGDNKTMLNKQHSCMLNRIFKFPKKINFSKNVLAITGRSQYLKKVDIESLCFM